MEQKKNLAEIERLTSENKSLQLQVLESMEYIRTIKNGNIDALISVHNNNLKIYTENAADRTYRLLIENMHEGAVLLDRYETILYCNSYFAGMIDQPLQKVIGTKFRLYIESSFSDHFQTLVSQGWEGNSQYEINLKKTGEHTFPVLISLNLLPLEKSHVLSIILSDLSVQKNTQKELFLKTRQLEEKNIELENANKDLTNFTYVSSHDLQEPLRKIHNFVNLLATDETSVLSEKGRHYFTRLKAATLRMQALISDLLTYSQTKSGDREFIPTKLSSLIAQIKTDYADIILDKGATIESSDTLLRVLPFQFNQLFHNLIWNSLKFSKPSNAPVIRITTTIVSGNKLAINGLSKIIDYCHIHYSDNGIGFEQQYAERIFEVFQRLNSREDYAGTGMGLAICKRIIENHNGSIAATGKLNIGATFEIYIPA